jgi:V8-like Glu-specific endopeptidase
MNGHNMSSFEPTIKELDMEWIARGAQTPLATLFQFTDKEGSPQRDAAFLPIKVLYHPDNIPPVNPRLKDFTLEEILLKMRQLIQEEYMDSNRGNWGNADRLDSFDVADERVRRNFQSVTLVCLDRDLQEVDNGFRQLRVKTYGNLYDLCPSEPFYGQPAAAGSICTGVLVAANVVLTAAHFVHESNVRELAFVFGYEMADSVSPVIRFPKEKIYRGVRVLQRQLDKNGPNATGSDWVLVQLDRDVEGQEIVRVSQKIVFHDQPVYVIGYPCGLPAKYAPGLVVENIEKAYFMSQMDIYSGNSGSPVFCAETHEMVGMLVRSDPQDFRRYKGGWISVRYPNKRIKSDGDRCLKVSLFERVVSELRQKRI